MKGTVLFLILIVFLLANTSAPALADSVAIQNASFESFDPLVNPCFCGMYSIGSIPGWTLTGGVSGSWQPTAASFPPPLPDGVTVAYTNGGTISQTLTSSLTPDTTYVLSVDVGHRLDGPNGFATDYTIALYSGSALLASFTASNSSIPMGTFADQTLTFTSGATVTPDDLRIVLSGAQAQADFDNVRLTASTVAEPSSLSLLASALGLMFLALRRR